MKAVAIWSPRYWDRKVLVAKTEIHSGKNYLYFCCDKNLPDLYSYDGNKVVEKCSICSNGKIACYEIPLDWLQSEGDLPEIYIPVREKEYNKYKNYKNKKS